MTFKATKSRTGAFRRTTSSANSSFGESRLLSKSSTPTPNTISIRASPPRSGHGTACTIAAPSCWK